MADPLHKLEGMALDLSVDASRDRLGEIEKLDDALLPRVGPPPGPVVAGVIWYKQAIPKLERLIDACAEHGIAAVMFLDGPYEGLSTQTHSPAETYDAIRDRCRAKNLAYMSFEGQVYVSEPMKRTASARVALAWCEENYPDEQPWFLYLDSDEFPMGPIDWDVVGRYGYGSIQLRNWDGPERVEGQGDGAKMTRLFPNSAGLVFGPAHYDIRDNSIPATYLGWEKALANSDDPCFELGHDFARKANEAEYQAYNDLVRYKAEGKVMRIVTNFREHGEMCVRMDTNSAEIAGWAPGFIVGFGESNMPDGYVYAIATHVDYVDDSNGELVDVHFDPIETKAAAERQAANSAEMAEKEQVMGDKLGKRLRKRARRWDREHGVGQKGGLPR